MLNIGDVLAERYKIVERIGSGGMADVYKAEDMKLNRNVAIKVMKQEYSEDSTFITKFRSEAQAAAGLSNPNIVSVYDVGEEGGDYYIVMELVDGITLKEYISKKGKLSVREATSIAIQVCMGLEAAHAQNIIHRDVKPQNIIISTDGKVKVTDFGIARAASSNTISANAMGSVHYSSPEQVRGGYADLRSDIYSLGISLYEMVTGKLPYDGDTTVAIAIKHLQDEMEPPSRYTPDLPRALEQIIYKCTQKSVDRRYQNMTEVIEDLKQSLVDPNGDFVVLAPLSSHAETIAVTPEEQAQIRAGDLKVEEGKNVPTFSSIDSAKKAENGEDIDPYEEDDDDDDDEGISGKLEKAMTIGGFIVGALIICVLIYFVGRAAGLFSFGRNSGESSAVESVASHEESEEENTQGFIEVPAIVGLTEEEAEEAAKALNLGIKYMGEKASSEYAEGRIMEQDPVAGTLVEEHTTITYYKSSGSETIAVPDIIGKSIGDAQSMLSAAGFTNVIITQAVSDDVAEGNVVSVSPGVGVQAGSDAQITVTVSSGPEPTPTAAPESSAPEVDNNVQITVRSYTGLTEEVATNAARGDGLTVRISYGSGNTVGLGEVLSQSLNVGDVVPGGTEIVFTINDPDRAAAQEAEQQAAAQQAASNAQGQSPAAAGVWSTDSVLGAPSNYTGGAYRLVLTQNVNGSTTQTTVSEGNSISFPFELICNGVSGVESGTVVLYEQVNGNYVNRASWPVSFTQAG